MEAKKKSEPGQKLEPEQWAISGPYPESMQDWLLLGCYLGNGTVHDAVNYVPQTVMSKMSLL